MGAYYTKEDITGYISMNTIIPFLFDQAKKKCGIAFEGDQSIWHLLKENPDRYIYDAVKKGIELELSEEIAVGIKDVSKRTEWNKPAPQEYALPTEIWREVVARRQRCEEVRGKMLNGEITSINDLITYNLDIRQFAQDVIENCEGPELLRAIYYTIAGRIPDKSNQEFQPGISVLDPTCGSGAFLFAALNILEPLYAACLDRMQVFLDELDSSGQKHRSDKFGDFRKILERIEQHPNRRYFVLKSIILNNLYGVDIMEEAIEICKLRLFLKLVAQVDSIDKIEPLPDIDFNIRAGNTLVGFADRDVVKEAITTAEGGQKKILFGESVETMTRIEENAEIADRAFKKFQEMQTELGMDAKDFSAAKQELINRLKALEDELDCYLARQYGISLSDETKYIKRLSLWRESHQPFHWFIEFYGIMKQGGFDVVIGNPPYVEYEKIQEAYTIRGYKTENCGNLYALIMESALKLKANDGRIGMIVPLSGHSTKRMKNLIKEFYNRASLLHLLNISADAHPSVLFPGVRFRLAIFLFAMNQNENLLYTTKYKRWFAEERDYLFKDIAYTQTPSLYGILPKIASSNHSEIINKLIHYKKTLALHSGSNVTYYHNAPVHWIRAHSFVPYFCSERDGVKRSTQLKPLNFESKEQALAASGVLCSSLFFIWWLTVSDCYHLNRNELVIFPLDLSNTLFVNKLALIAERLNEDMMAKSKRRVYIYKTTGRVEYDEFYLKLSKQIIDEIDFCLAEYYGFTDEELDFIINYDVKYRMGLI